MLISSHSPSPSATPFPQLRVNTNLLSVPVDLLLLDILCGRNQMIGSLSCLTYFTLHVVFEVHPCCGMRQYFVVFIAE